MQTGPDQTMVLSASDVVEHAECGHRSILDLDAALGLHARPTGSDDEQELVRARGHEHEERVLAVLAAGTPVVHVPNDAPEDERSAVTLAAVRAGAPLIYQASLTMPGLHFTGRWQGYPDLLERVELDQGAAPAFLEGEPLAWTYRPVDIKLAASVKPAAVIQLAVYRRLLEHLLGVVPDDGALIVGTGERHTVDLAAVSPYVDALMGRLVATVAAPDQDSYPYPVEGCSTCPWQSSCAQRWRDDDHLSQVAGIRRAQVVKLEAAGVRTVADLATSPPEGTSIGAATLATLHAQARAQVRSRTTARPHVELRAPEAGRGLALLPEPSPGDVFFDMEGDPFAEGGDGLEYLFGVVDLGPDSDAGAPDSERVSVADAGSGDTADTGASDMRFLAWWAHSRTEEKAAFEGFVRYVMDRRERYPDLRVYHYAPYERTALGRLAALHATCEEEVDTLLREGVLVDLYQVVRQAVVVGATSYSIKALEPLYMSARQGEVTSAGSSIVEYERWLRTGDPATLASIRAYNRDDVVSTRLLRDWLETQRAAASVTERPEPAEQPAEGGASPAPAPYAELLTDADPAVVLSGQLTGWHRREDRPAWWSYFSRLRAGDADLFDDMEALVGIEADGEPEADGRSYVHRYRFDPRQPTKLRDGSQLVSVPSGRTFGTIASLDPAAGRFTVRRRGRSPVEVPVAVAAGGPPPSKQQQARLHDAVAAVADHPQGPSHALQVARAGGVAADLIAAAGPRTRGGGPLVRDGESAAEALPRLLLELDGGVLAVQGPPGSGKTTTSAAAIVTAVAAGLRVGVCANAHDAIANLLHAVAREAARRELTVGILHAGGREPTATVAVAANRDAAAKVTTDPTLRVVGGTSWLFCREELAGMFDLLVVDEAGQLSLANAVAISHAARSLVLVGDPQQLPQPLQGTHPGASRRSALEHLIGERPTVDPERGLLLPTSFRMHPELCRYVSSRYYRGALSPADGTEHQALAGTGVGALDGAGLSWVPVSHRGNAAASREEAAVVVELVRVLLTGRYADRHGVRPMGGADVLVVAPYNAQVNQLRSALRQAGLGEVRVGTVDRFQGQQAPVVVFSLATSAPADLPRDVSFLFSPNRWNVALSRAQARAVVVGSPDLTRTPARTLDQMVAVSGLCGYVASAAHLDPAALAGS